MNEVVTIQQYTKAHNIRMKKHPKGCAGTLHSMSENYGMFVPDLFVSLQK